MSVAQSQGSAPCRFRGQHPTVTRPASRMSLVSARAARAPARCARSTRARPARQQPSAPARFARSAVRPRAIRRGAGPPSRGPRLGDDSAPALRGPDEACDCHTRMRAAAVGAGRQGQPRRQRQQSRCLAKSRRRLSASLHRCRCRRVVSHRRQPRIEASFSPSSSMVSRSAESAREPAKESSCARRISAIGSAKPYWGRGIVTAAGRAMLDHLQQMRASCVSRRRCSNGIPRRCACSRNSDSSVSRILRKSVTKDGQLIDSVLYTYLL